MPNTDQVWRRNLSQSWALISHKDRRSVKYLFTFQILSTVLDLGILAIVMPLFAAASSSDIKQEIF